MMSNVLDEPIVIELSDSDDEVKEAEFVKDGASITGGGGGGGRAHKHQVTA